MFFVMSKMFDLFDLFDMFRLFVLAKRKPKCKRCKLSETVKFSVKRVIGERRKMYIYLTISHILSPDQQPHIS